MLDPVGRWASFGEKPDYCGLLSYAALPYSEDASALEGIDVAVVGAPFDELNPEGGKPREGPRAIRAASLPFGPDVSDGIDASAHLRMIDFGDAAVQPCDVAASQGAIRDLVETVCAAGVLPIVLGGDHSITEPEAQALFQSHGAIGLIQLDAHTDTSRSYVGSTKNNGTMFRSLVEAGIVDGRRYAQVGVRGHWPDQETWDWQRERGIVHYPMAAVRSMGLGPLVAEVASSVGDGPVLLTVDIDVLDPAYAPGTGAGEPGGLTSSELLTLCRGFASVLELVGADVVEVSPIWPGQRDTTAAVADRVVKQILTGVAARRTTAEGRGGR